MYVKKSSAKRRSARIVSRRKLIFSVGLIVLIAVAVLIFVFTKSSNPLDHLQLLPFSSETSCVYNKFGILYSQADTLSCLDKSGELLWSTNLFASDVSLFASDSYVVAYNQESVQVFDANTGKPYFTKKMEGAAVRVITGYEHIGVFYSVTAGDTANNYLMVLDLKGNEIDNLSFGTQNILNYGFYQNSDALWVLSLDTSGVTPISRVATYNPGKSLTGSIDLNEYLVEDVFVYGDNMYIFSTNFLRTYDLYGAQQNSSLVYGWKLKSTMISDGQPLFL